jgi:hypothetical protein
MQLSPVSAAIVNSRSRNLSQLRLHIAQSQLLARRQTLDDPEMRVTAERLSEIGHMVDELTGKQVRQ